MTSLIHHMFDGPLDVIGDIHGEYDALRALLKVLGYDDNGEHAAGRRLVFLGDLCDRGPDSPAVIELVRSLVARGIAQCVVGNHEMSLLQQDAKHGNRWYLDPSHHEQRGEFVGCKPAPAELKPAWHEFFLSLPVALERADLRIVHAAWHAPSMDALRSSTHATALDAFEHYEQTTLDHFEQSGLARAADEEEHTYALALVTEATAVPYLPNLAKKEELAQMGNPVRIATSGTERVTTEPFWSNGKWRMCLRVPWWNEYADETSVIVGHYWRDASDRSGVNVSGGRPNLFDGSAANEWVGAKRNVFCVDFSVGGRYRERARNLAQFATRLGAVRWPEQDLVFDDGMIATMQR